MTEQIQIRLIEDEMRENYVDYAMSVIVGRALPDVRDGLKPVHRRILYAMYGLGLLHNKAFKKSANVVGTCLAKYHPHGDVAVYDSLVRMAQDFSLRYPLIDGQGNFGSIDGDFAAAYRYTEARLKKLSEELLEDLEKETVDFTPNYDNSDKEPLVLPSKIPNLLVNGSSGIAVGMATNIPPHNMREVVDACVKFIENKDIPVQELMNSVAGPDFPTGGIIVNAGELKNIYETGRGRVVTKAKTKFEGNKIIIEEIPYMLNKALLIQNMADLVRDGKIDGISDLRDESDRDGMRIVVELKKNANQDIVLNNLMQNTQLKSSFGVIMLALVNNEPKILNLKELIENYVLHRKEVVARRCRFELREASERKHVLEGIKVALDNIDDVILNIKSSRNAEEARILLVQNYNLSEVQANAILDMRLQRLTSLETDKVINEIAELTKTIHNLEDVLGSELKVLNIVKQELMEIKEKYGDDRRTVIVHEEEIIGSDDLIKEENIVVLSTREGYIKQLPLDTYKQQKRGGTGIISAEVKEEDAVEHIFATSNLNYLTFFTNKGNIYWLKAYEIPSAGRYSKGRAIANLLNMEKEERITSILPVDRFDDKYLVFATKQGMIKKSVLSEYGNVRKGGVIAINLRENDEVVDVVVTHGENNLILATRRGIANHFSEKDVSVVGRNATGVRGINLVNDEVIGMEIALPGSCILTVSEKGYGKRTKVDEYRFTNRGSRGVINLLCNEKTGSVAAIKDVFDDDELILISEKGNVIRINVKYISILGRNTQGVKLMRLENDRVSSVEKIVKG